MPQPIELGKLHIDITITQLIHPESKTYSKLHVWFKSYGNRVIPCESTEINMNFFFWIFDQTSQKYLIS